MKDNTFKQLQEAGFPLKRKNVNEVKYKMPTLDFLIKQCGDEFELTNCKGLLRRIETDSRWLAEKSYGTEKPPILIGGDTPEEAVAKLWLAINKK